MPRAPVWLIAVIALLQVAAALAGDHLPADAQNERPWLTCHAALRRAAKLAAEGQADEAAKTLEAAAARLPEPYAYHVREAKALLIARFGNLAGEATHDQCRLRASAMVQCGEPTLALPWAREAVRRGPKFPYIDHAQVGWILAATGQYAEAVGQYEEAIRLGKAANATDIEREYERHIKEIRAASLDNSLEARLQFVRIHYLSWKGHGYHWANKHYFLAMEQLTNLFDATEEESHRRIIYDAMRNCFEGLGDRVNLAAWEAKLLAEPWAKPDDAAIRIAERGQQAYYNKDFARAERQWRLIVEKYRQSRHVGIAQYNVGVALKRQKKYDAAIAEFQKLFDSPVNDREAGANVMEMFRGYHHHGAKQTALCYEAKGDIEKALEWVGQARDKYTFQSWCGTCNGQVAMAIETQQIRLLRKANKIDEALRLAEKAVFDNDWAGAPVQFGVFVAEEYESRGKAQELSTRLEKYRAEKYSPGMAWYVDPDGRPHDGHSEATRAAVETLAILEFAKKGRIDELWRKIQKSRTSAMLALVTDPEQRAKEAIAGAAAIHLMANKNAVSYLKRKLSGSFSERAWATVLLVKMGEFKDVEAIQEMALKIPDDFSSDEWRSAADRAKDDFCFALLLLNVDPNSKFYRSLGTTHLAYAARDAANHVAEAEERAEGVDE